MVVRRSPCTCLAIHETRMPPLLATAWRLLTEKKTTRSSVERKTHATARSLAVSSCIANVLQLNISAMDAIVPIAKIHTRRLLFGTRRSKTLAPRMPKPFSLALSTRMHKVAKSFRKFTTWDANAKSQSVSRSIARYVQ